jgi:hypothetical protein
LLTTMNVKMRIALAALCCGACHNPVDSDRPAAIRFVLVAPLCSSVMPVEFFVDAQSVGVDTFRVNVSEPHIASRDFAVLPGTRTLEAQVVGGYVWPPDTVSILPGSVYADSLAFYCS